MQAAATQNSNGRMTWKQICPDNEERNFPNYVNLQFQLLPTTKA